MRPTASSAWRLLRLGIHPTKPQARQISEAKIQEILRKDRLKKPPSPLQGSLVTASLQAKQSLYQSIFASTTFILFQHNSLTVREWLSLRGSFGSDWKVVTLSSQLLHDMVQHEQLKVLIRGPLAVAFPVAKTKATYTEPSLLKPAIQALQKESKTFILGGLIDDQFLDHHDMENFSRLASLEETRQRLLKSIVAVPIGLVKTLAHPGVMTARVLKARVDGDTQEGEKEVTK